MTHPTSADPSAALETALGPLSAKKPRLEVVDAALSEVQASLPWPMIHNALLARVEAEDTARDRLALVLHATDPDVAADVVGKGHMEGVFEVLVAAADGRRLELFLSRVTPLIDAAPLLRRDLPSVPRLLDIADQIEDTLTESAEGLITLAQQIEDLNEAEDD